MRLTPLDLQNHRFAHRLRGYDPHEVDGFVRMVGEDYEELVRENESLRETSRALELRVAELAGQEGRLRETLVTAQTLSEDLKRTAIREAEMRVAEAEVRAEKILDAAHRRAAKLREEIRELRLLRSRVTAAVRSALETHTALLDGLLAEAADADARAEASPAAEPFPARTERAAAAPDALPAPAAIAPA
jgi:cell division initiation protein